jgi:transcriptional regulator
MSKGLTREDAVQIWTLHHEGYYQQEIASRFGCNSARVWDVLHERKFVGSRDKAAKTIGMLPSIPCRRPNPRANAPDGF